MFCSNCGKPLQPGAQFCGTCGKPVEAAPAAAPASAPVEEATIVRPPEQASPPPVTQPTPPAYIPPAGAPVTPAAPNAAMVGITRQLGRMLLWDWVGPLKIAGATLGTSLILAIIFGLTTKPSDSHLHWGFKTVYTWLVWWWDSMFGVSLVSGANASGSYDGVSGSGSAHAGFAAMPLTLTVLTLVVAAFVFRRVIRNCTSALSAVLVGARAALFIAIPLWFFSLFASLSIDDLAKLAGLGKPTTDTYNGQSYSYCNSACSYLQTLHQAKSRWVDWSFALTPSSTQAFFISFLLVLGLFAALTLSRAEWFTGRVLGAVRLCLLAPMHALGAIAPALVAAGLVFSFVSLIVRWNSHTGFHSVHPSLSTHNWIILIFTFIAYAGNSGVMALGLGSWGNFGGTVSANWNANVPGINGAGSGSISCSVQHGMTWWAHASNTITSNPCSGFGQDRNFYSTAIPGADWGVWTAAILAPIVLIYVAIRILKANGTDAKSMLTSLGTWVLSLLVVMPVISYLAEIAIDGDASGSLNGATAGSASGNGSISLGLAGSTTFLVFGYGLLFALIIGLATGAINRSSFSGLTAIADQARAQQAAQRAAQAQQAGPVPPAYQPPAQTPPAYQPPPDQPPPPYQG